MLFHSLKTIVIRKLKLRLCVVGVVPYPNFTVYRSIPQSIITISVIPKILKVKFQSNIFLVNSVKRTFCHYTILQQINKLQRFCFYFSIFFSTGLFVYFIFLTIGRPYLFQNLSKPPSSFIDPYFMRLQPTPRGSYIGFEFLSLKA